MWKSIEKRVDETYLFKQSKKASVLTHPCIFWRSNSILTICKVWIAIFTWVGPKWHIGEADENIIASVEVDERSESNKRIELGDDWSERTSEASKTRRKGSGQVRYRRDRGDGPGENYPKTFLLDVTRWYIFSKVWGQRVVEKTMNGSPGIVRRSYARSIRSGSRGWVVY